MMTTSYLSLVRDQAHNRVLRNEIMRVIQITVFYFGLLTLLAYMVSHCNAMFSNRNIVPEEEECSLGAHQDKKTEETEKKAENERKTVQPLHIRVPRFPDVSVLFINKIS